MWTKTIILPITLHTIDKQRSTPFLLDENYRVIPGKPVTVENLPGTPVTLDAPAADLLLAQYADRGAREIPSTVDRLAPLPKKVNR